MFVSIGIGLNDLSVFVLQEMDHKRHKSRHKRHKTIHPAWTSRLSHPGRADCPARTYFVLFVSASLCLLWSIQLIRCGWRSALTRRWSACPFCRECDGGKC